MDRSEKVKQFFIKNPYFRAHWCKAKVCACMGCVNNYPKKTEWYSMFPEDRYLTEEDIKIYLANIK